MPCPSIFDELNRNWWGDSEVLDDMLILQELKEMYKEDCRIELPNVEEWCIVKTKKRQQKASHTKKSKSNTPDKSNINKKSLKTKNNNTKKTNNRPKNNKPINNKPINNKPINNKPTNNKPTNNKPTNNKPTNNKPTNNKPTNNNKKNIDTSDTKEINGNSSKNKRINSKKSQIIKYGTVTNVVKGGCVFIKSDDASNTGTFVCPEIKKIKIGDKVQFRTSKDTDTQHFQKAVNVRLIKDKK